MRIRKRKAASLPVMAMTNLALASWETIAHRTMMMAQNKCSPAEYQRMVNEKATAAMQSGMKLISSGGRASLSSLMAPWLSKATANAKRLRRKRK
jgi:hypothetical protein